MQPRGVAVLGSTGSIGRTTLQVIGSFPDRFRVVALTAHRRADLLSEQVAEYEPELAALADGEVWSPGGSSATRVKSGWEGVLEAAAHRDAEVVVNALVGAAGLEPSLRALEAGKRLALANKESLVVGGPLVMRALETHGGELVPVDSEHSAIFQCLHGEPTEHVRRIVLTASGGPFRDRDRSELREVTPEDALDHPNWDMGAKITVDSATLVNKALEVMEAHHLFGVPYEAIDVVIHRQSIVHSLVEFRDGSVLAQLGHPTMTVPILYALSWPERLPFETPPLDVASVGTLEFEPVPSDRFLAFELGRQAAVTGGTMPAVYNAANEEAVTAFLDDRLPFLGIPRVIEQVMERHAREELSGLDVVRRADQWSRDTARTAVRQIGEEIRGRSA